MLHCLVHIMNVEQARRIGDGGVAAIENADLHMLVGRHVGHELHTDLFQRRAPGGKIVFEHPLLEAFAEHRPGVVDAELVGQQGLLAFRGGRGDAVHHAIGEGDRGLDPLGQFRVDQRGQTGDRIFGDVAIARNIVAAHYREGDNASLSTFDQTRQDQTERGFRRIEMSRVMRNVGMGWIECLAGRVDIVAALGNGQRDDADGRIRQPGNNGRAVAGRQIVDHGAGNVGSAMVGLLLDHGGEPVLPHQLLPHRLIGRAYAGAHQRPVVPLTQIEQRVEIDGLMGAMKIADAEMHNAGGETGAGIGRGDRSLDRWKRCSGKPGGHVG